MESENLLGIVLARFPGLENLRLKGKDWRQANDNIIRACFILHNLCIDWGDAQEVSARELPPEPSSDSDDDVDQRARTGVQEHDLKREALTRYLAERFDWEDEDVVLRE